MRFLCQLILVGTVLIASCVCSFSPQPKFGSLEYTANSCNTKIVQQSGYVINGRQEGGPAIVNQDPPFPSLKSCMEMYWPGNNEGMESP
jgi:hypothetical protein